MADGSDLGITFRLVKPDDPMLIGIEAYKLAMSASVWQERVYKKLAFIVRDGFRINFQSESNAEEKWPPLAKRTLEEREEEGYPYGPIYPMLVRTGRYRDSWLDPQDELHIEDIEVNQRKNQVIVAVGSRHPWAETHEEGGFPHETLDVFGFTVTGAYVPPRPVRFIRQEFEDRIGTDVTAELSWWANQVR